MEKNLYFSPNVPNYYSMLHVSGFAFYTKILLVKSHESIPHLGSTAFRDTIYYIYIMNSAIIQLDVNSHDGTGHHHSALQRYLRRTCCFFWKLPNSKRTCRVEGILMRTPVANRDIIIATQHFLFEE